jgi:hypothetical protein
MGTKTRRRIGLHDKPLTVEELDVLGEALDEYQQGRRYAAGLANGTDRAAMSQRARVAARLLARVGVEEQRGAS